jgi:hypothetical protein
MRSPPQIALGLDLAISDTHRCTSSVTLWNPEKLPSVHLMGFKSEFLFPTERLIHDHILKMMGF